MSDNNSFGKFVPGFDFLQGLATQAVKGAASGLGGIPQLPNPSNWIAPTLSVEELDKRIDELKTVQFWLDQNAKALQATITALEVQKMTLATLKGMNFNMGDVANAFKLKAADAVTNSVSSALDKVGVKSGTKKKPVGKKTVTKPGPGAKIPNATGLPDPMQWWGSLTQQFGDIASNAMKEAGKQTALDTTRHMASAAVKTARRTTETMGKSVVSNASKMIANNLAKSAAIAKKSSQKIAASAPKKSASKPTQKRAKK
jgi:hypothetical protein